MVTAYLQDEIKIIPISTDEFGQITEGAAVTSSARVKYEVKTVLRENGKEAQSTATLMLPYNTELKNGDKLQVTKINGETAPEPNKKYLVIKKGIAHGFSTWQGWIKAWIV